MRDDDKRLYFENLFELQDFKDGEISTRVLVKYGNFSSTLICMKSGQSIDTHNSTGDACIQVLEGEGILAANGEETILIPGSYVFIPASIHHAVRATNNLTMLLCLSHNVPDEEFYRDTDDTSYARP